MRGTLMSINYFRQYELRNRDIVTLAPAHEVNKISIIFLIAKMALGTDFSPELIRKILVCFDNFGIFSF